MFNQKAFSARFGLVLAGNASVDAFKIFEDDEEKMEGMVA